MAKSIENGGNGQCKGICWYRLAHILDGQTEQEVTRMDDKKFYMALIVILALVIGLSILLGTVLL